MDLNTNNKKNNMSNFFQFFLRYSLSQKFYKNPIFCWKFWHNPNTSQCQFFISNLKSCKEVASLYSLVRFTRKNIIIDIVSIPYFTVFLFSLDISWKFLTLCVFSRKIIFFPQLVEICHLSLALANFLTLTQ